MTGITRRDALLGASAAVAVAGVPTALAAQPDPLLAGVQALVNEIRQDLGGELIVATHWALHQAADRLEVLPGVQAVPNEYWVDWRKALGERSGPPRVLRLAGGPPS